MTCLYKASPKIQPQCHLCKFENFGLWLHSCRSSRVATDLPANFENDQLVEEQILQLALEAFRASAWWVFVEDAACDSWTRPAYTHSHEWRQPCVDLKSRPKSKIRMITVVSMRITDCPWIFKLNKNHWPNPEQSLELHACLSYAIGHTRIPEAGAEDINM